MTSGARFLPFTASSKTGAAIVLAVCLLFFAVGQAFIPRLGIENDEAVFANSYFDGAAAAYHLGNPGIPLMVTNYAGTLKTWICAPIFRTFGTGVWELREPVLIAAAIGVWLFFLAMRRAVGVRAAVIGSCLLAVDSEYLLTSVYDWGPVALQHLLLIGGVLLAIRFRQTLLTRELAGAAFLMGLAMWEKALAVWLLSGMAVAALLVYGREVFRLFTPRRAAIAGAAFCLGALPLIVFNAHSDLATFRKNTARDTIPLSAKAQFLWTASKGGALFGYFMPDDWQTPAPHAPKTALEHISAFVSKAAGHPRRNGMPYLFIAALLLAPLARWAGVRAILFCLITLGIAWLEMAWNANTGASIHHTILLWPLPQAVIGISLAAASRKLGHAGLPILAAALGLFLAVGALVMNEYHAQMVRNGSTAGWTTALSPLSDYLKAHPAKSVFCMDWGMLNSLLLLSDGQLKLYVGTDPVFNKQSLSADDLREVRWMLEQPGAEFVAHTPDAEFFKGANERLVEVAAGLGYRRDSMAVIPDGFGRNVFEVYRFARTAQ